jgi:flagellar protein FliO/FliZ
LFTIIVISFFLLPAAGLFAQDASAGVEPGIGSQELDAITAAERALPLGDDGGAAMPPPATSTLGIFRVILTLAVVAAAIYGIIFFIKRLSRGRGLQDPFLRILASTALGANRGAHIISVGSQAWLVGSGENGVNLISEIGDKDILNAMLLEDSRKSAITAAGGKLDFRALLGRLGVSTGSNPPSPKNIRSRSERIKEL